MCESIPSAASQSMFNPPTTTLATSASPITCHGGRMMAAMMTNKTGGTTSMSRFACSMDMVIPPYS